VSDDYTKMNKAELIELIKSLNEELDIEMHNINELYALNREANNEIRLLKAKITREQFAHEMTCEEAESYRNELLDERLYASALRNKSPFYINHKGDEIHIKNNFPPF